MNKKEKRSSITINRIIETSLELFNTQGERPVTTNHIAAALHMSPGNLYYHFANKDEIIVSIYKQYSREIYAYLTGAALPENIAQTVGYMRGVYDVLWRYRFLFGDVNSLLNRSADLLGEHNELTRERISPLLVNLLAQLRDKGVIQIDEIGLADLSINIWLITKYWFDFNHSLRRGLDDNEESAKRHGICRTLSLIRPYLDKEHLAEFDQTVQELIKTAA